MSFALDIKTADDLAAERAEAQAASLRAERDRRLAACDWVLIRAQETGDPAPQAWRDYRQALRDVTDQPGFPDAVTWPEEPADDEVEE